MCSYTSAPCIRLFHFLDGRRQTCWQRICLFRRCPRCVVTDTRRCAGLCLAKLGRLCDERRGFLTCFCQEHFAKRISIVNIFKSNLQRAVKYFYDRAETTFLESTFSWLIVMWYSAFRGLDRWDLSVETWYPLCNTGRWRTRLLKYRPYDFLTVLAPLSVLFCCGQQFSVTYSFASIRLVSLMSSVAVFWVASAVNFWQNWG